jgi:hypothetical protein
MASLEQQPLECVGTRKLAVETWLLTAEHVSMIANGACVEPRNDHSSCTLTIVVDSHLYRIDAQANVCLSQYNW